MEIMTKTIDRPLEWIIRGEFTDYGSFSRQEEAETYALALRTLRNLECEVVKRD